MAGHGRDGHGARGHVLDVRARGRVLRRHVQQAAGDAGGAGLGVLRGGARRRHGGGHRDAARRPGGTRADGGAGREPDRDVRGRAGSGVRRALRGAGQTASQAQAQEESGKAEGQEESGAANGMRLLAGIGGALLLAIVLWDAFETIILPRRVNRRLRLTRAFYRATWIPWAASAGLVRAGNRREEFLSFYGPLSLVLLLPLWAAGLVTRFRLLQNAHGSLVPVPGYQTFR